MQSALFFDWYAASIDSTPDIVINTLKLSYPNESLEPCRANNGFTHADKLVDPSGDTVLTFWYGGCQQGSKVFVFASGQYAQRFSEVVRFDFPDHELVRADVAIDYDDEGVYLSLMKHGIRTSRAVSVKNRFIGEAGSEFAQSSSDGRSLYIGSRSSVSMIRIYEKGKKDDKTRPNWVRSEFEFKPKGSEARLYYAKASLSQIVSATKLGKAFFSALGVAVSAVAVAAGTVRVKSCHDRAFEYLIRQYQNTIKKQLAIVGGCPYAFVDSLTKHENWIND